MPNAPMPSPPTADGPPGTPSLRTLGSGPNQAAPASAALTNITTYADLRNIVGATSGLTAPSAVNVNGITSPLDGGEGQFIWTTDTTSADDNGVVIVPTLAPRTGCWKRQIDDGIKVSWYGAKGDGVTNDTDALAAASAKVQAMGGGKLILEPRTYIVGKQTFAGATGLGYAYRATDPIKIVNCTRAVIIDGNGAKLKIASGLRFGSFHPVTGNVYNPPSMPFLNNDYTAQVGHQIYLENNTSVEVRNIELDGNVSGLLIGGTYGDTGRQLQAYGVFLFSNQNAVVQNVYTHHHALDGAIIGFPGLTEKSVAYPHSFDNVISENNARQGLSIVGTSSFVARNCRFNNTGKDIPIASAPGAGVDIEAEGSVNRSMTFIECEFINNAGAAMVADTGDSADAAFIRCKFIGTTSCGPWVQKPRFSFTDCIMVGSIVSMTATTTFTRCLFTDEVKYSDQVFVEAGRLLFADDTMDGITLDSCVFNTTQSRPGRFDGALLTNCVFNHSAGTDFVANQEWVIIFSRATIEDVVINDLITVNPPTDAYLISVMFGARSRGNTRIVSTNKKIRWNSWSTGAGGGDGLLGEASYVGFNGQTSTDEAAKQKLTLSTGAGHPNVPYFSTRNLMYGSGIPTTGTYVRGDKIFADNPTFGTPNSWTCIVSGTPGTWVSDKDTEFNVEWWGAKADSGVTDNTAAINNALSYINSIGGGTLIFPSHAAGAFYGHSGTINMATYKAISVIGRGTQGGDISNSACVVKCTGNPATAWTLASANGLSFEGLFFACHPTYAGVVVSLDTTLSGDTSRINFTRCAFGAGLSGNTAAYLVALSRSIIVNFYACDFRGCISAIRGKKQTDSDGSSNCINITDCSFVNQGCTTNWIENPDDSWSIKGCNFGGRADGSIRVMQSTLSSRGGVFSGNWIGDTYAIGPVGLAVGGDAAIRGVFKGWSFHGNTGRGPADLHFISLLAGSEGVSVRGNTLSEWLSAVRLTEAPTSTIPELDVAGNHYLNIWPHTSKVWGLPANGQANQNIVNQTVYHNWVLRAEQSVSQSIPNMVETTIVFNEASVNPSNALNLSTGVFIAPRTGFYLVSTSVRLVSLSTTGFMTLRIFRDGVLYSVSGYAYPNGNAGADIQGAASNYADIVRLDAGQALQIKAHHNFGSTAQTLTVGVERSSFLSIVYIHNQG